MQTEETTETPKRHRELRAFPHVNADATVEAFHDNESAFDFRFVRVRDATGMRVFVALNDFHRASLYQINESAILETFGEERRARFRGRTGRPFGALDALDAVRVCSSYGARCDSKVETCDVITKILEHARATEADAAPPETGDAAPPTHLESSAPARAYQGELEGVIEGLAREASDDEIEDVVSAALSGLFAIMRGAAKASHEAGEREAHAPRPADPETPPAPRAHIGPGDWREVREKLDELTRNQTRLASRLTSALEGAASGWGAERAALTARVERLEAALELASAPTLAPDSAPGASGESSPSPLAHIVDAWAHIAQQTMGATQQVRIESSPGEVAVYGERYVLSIGAPPPEDLADGDAPRVECLIEDTTGEREPILETFSGSSAPPQMCPVWRAWRFFENAHRRANALGAAPAPPALSNFSSASVERYRRGELEIDEAGAERVARAGEDTRGAR